MRIVQITAGAGGRICGSCLHDNALVRALRRRGRDAILVPAYVPTTTDEENVAEPTILCGGVNVWLQEHLPLFRHTPGWVDAIFDSRSLLDWLSNRTGGTRPADLGGLTASSLRGEAGHQRKEVDKLARWLAEHARPEIVHLSNALLVGFARRIRELTGARIVCSLSGEDIFIEQIPEPHYSLIRGLLRERSADVDRFVALNDFFAGFMRGYLDLPAGAVEVVPHGVDLEGYPSAPREAGAGNRSGTGRRRVGYLARACPEKGLDLLVRALPILAATHDVEVVAAGATVAAEQDYVRHCLALAADLGVGGRLSWRGQVDRAGKIDLFESSDLFAMPTRHPEAKGLPVIEAMAAGLPIVAPRHGAFPELIAQESAAGPAGLLHEPGDPADLARAVAAVLDDPPAAAKFSSRGHALVRQRNTFECMAAGHEAIYEQLG